jgi:GTP-binding protein HflX
MITSAQLRAARGRGGGGPPPPKGGGCAISARSGEGIAALLSDIDRALQSGRERLHIVLPAARGDLLARLHRSGTVLREEYRDGHVDVTALVPPKLAGQVRKSVAGARESGS